MNNKILLPLALLCGGAAMAQEQKPNVVVLFVDDLGWADLGYNNPVFDTPNIDQLKSDGVYFSRAYVSTATSSPSRASLLTGKEALRCGFVRHIYDNPERAEFQTFERDPGNMKSRGWLPLEEITYAERTKEYGYYNQFVGKWHLGHDDYYPTKQGFDAMYGTCEHGMPNCYYQPFFITENPFPNAGKDEHLTEVISKGAEDFIKNYDKDQPFLLNLWYYGVHGPQTGRRDLVEKCLANGMSKADANNAGMIKTLDESVGRIRAALEEKGVADNTVIFFTSDQGGAFKNGNLRGGKMGGDALAEGGSRIPFIMYAPGMKANGTTYEKPIQTLDIYPTIIELASGKKCKDKQINGVSLLPVLNGKDLKERDLFLHRSYEDQNSAIINGDWKLIKYRSGKTQLYNIKNDESETTNLINLYPDKTKEMLERINKWQAEATPEYLLP